MTASERTTKTRRRGPRAVISSALALFFATLALLGWQVRTGHDPVLNTAYVQTHGKPGAVQTRTSGHHSAQAKPGHHRPAPARSATSGHGHHGDSGGESDS